MHQRRPTATMHYTQCLDLRKEMNLGSFAKSRGRMTVSDVGGIWFQILGSQTYGERALPELSPCPHDNSCRTSCGRTEQAASGFYDRIDYTVVRTTAAESCENSTYQCELSVI